VRASRLLTVLLLLQARGRMTAQELAAELEVSVRTVYRDVEALGAAGVPVYADRGPAGGYRLVDGYRTRLTGMTSEEAESLFLSGMPGPAAELGLGAVLAAAELKVLAALPPELRARAGRIRERFHLDAPGWFRGADRTPHLAGVADAVWGQHRIRVRYRRWDNTEATRELEPLGLVLKAGRWYLVAAADQRPRTYRVSRIRTLDRLDDRFDRPESFDLAGFWARAAKQVEETLYQGQAVIRLSPRGQQMIFLCGAVVADAARKTVGAPDADGWVEAVIPMETIEHATRSLLQLGADAEVLEPAELRRSIASECAALSRRYAESGTHLASAVGDELLRADIADDAATVHGPV
jgi:predicted DNA-binding transcriptional regulator YafY